MSQIQEPKASLAPSMTYNQIEELKKDPRNQLYEYKKETVHDTGVKFEPKMVVKRFRQMRKDFIKISEKRPDFSNDQCKQKLMLMPKYSQWHLFLLSYPKFSSFVLNKESKDDAVVKYLDSAANALQYDASEQVSNHKDNKVDKNHPDYDKIMNKRNQVMASNLFSSKLVTMKPIDSK